MRYSVLSRLPDPIGGVPDRRYRRAAGQIDELPARKTEIRTRRQEIQVMGMVRYGMQDAFLLCFCGSSDVVWCESSHAVFESAGDCYDAGTYFQVRF
jgi:hypothetical protein